MFTYTDPVADEALIASADTGPLGDHAREALRLSQQAGALAVLAAHEIGRRTYTERLNSGGRNGRPASHSTAEKAALGEVSLQMRISRSKAAKWITLGDQLATLPKFRAQFLAGKHSIHRMSLLAASAQDAPEGDLRDRWADADDEALDSDTDATDLPDQPTFDDLPDDVEADADADTPGGDRADDQGSDTEDDADEGQDEDAEPITFEDLALDLAQRSSTDPALRDELNEALIELDPDRAEKIRDEFGEAWQNVTITDDAYGHVNVDACMPTEHGVHLRDRIARMLKRRVCRLDPRTLGQQRVEALAEIQGAPGAKLRCQCGLDTCPAAKTRTRGNRGRGVGVPQPADTTFDAEAPQTSDIATDIPADADEPTDAGVDAVVTAGDADEVASNNDTAASADNTDSDDDEDPTTAPSRHTLYVDPTGRDVTRLAGYGAIDPAHAERVAPQAQILTAPAMPERRTTSGLVLLGNRSPAPPIDPSGHGGFGNPPPGALTYAPPAALRAEIRYLDHRCRYPFCNRPSDTCELDHLVKFNHADPLAGGWTVPYNLIPLCRSDHDRKHDGPWIPTMHTDRTVTWTNLRTGQTIITHPR
ncbi:MAG: hypothetical protein SW127_16835 [Actinomycetota bacterium]|nr:hypothetical protein [Actinomycetota bacterium]